MEKRETKKRVTIKGREFVVHAFDPMFGNYLACKIMADILGAKNKMEALVKSLTSKSKEEFMALQKDILAYCYEPLPSGHVCVVNEDGNIALKDITAPTILALMVNTIFFGMKDFLDQEVMEGLVQSLSELMPAQQEPLSPKRK